MSVRYSKYEQFEREWKNEMANRFWKFMEAHPDKEWNWYWISKNPNITWEIIEANPDKPWNWALLNQHPNIFMPSSKFSDSIKAKARLLTYS